MDYPKRLIEVDLPIKRISVQASREKSIRHGHISTLHIWWARRPLAACRAVLCASLWIDPADQLCPNSFIDAVKKEMLIWSSYNYISLLSNESAKNFLQLNKNKKLINETIFLRTLLLDFIADFSNWNNSIKIEFLKTSKVLTDSANFALGGEQGASPLVVDPFAGGGSIPLESLRVGAESFASDLNPLPILINKVLIEYIPKYKSELSIALRKTAEVFLNKAKELLLFEYYPLDEKKNIPVAYIWARTVICEGPNCGTEIPLIHSLILAKRKKSIIGFKLIPDKINKKINIEIHNSTSNKDFSDSFMKKNTVICPCCGYTLKSDSIRKQLIPKQGGAKHSRLLCVITLNGNKNGKIYRLPNISDEYGIQKAENYFVQLIGNETNKKLIPEEELPVMSGVFNAPLYGHNNWATLFTKRQLLSTIIFQKILNEIKIDEIISNKNLIKPLKTLIGFAIDRVIAQNSSLSWWQPKGEFCVGTFGRQALPMMYDFCEIQPVEGGSGDLKGAFDWIIKVCERESIIEKQGNCVKSSALSIPLPNQSADCIFTDPPYYNAVPYADLSDYFYLWLKKILNTVHPDLFEEESSPKKEEICEMAGWDSIRYPNKDSKWYEENMKKAMIECKRIIKPQGLCIVVFAHKSTEGWEAQLQAMLDAGWVFTASWPIDTERSVRMRANNSAALSSSIHIVCRPKLQNIENQIIGDWREILKELPKRINEWMLRLSEEGVIGADAIFACLGPALEIFSRYDVVEKPNGNVVNLHEYLEQVWAAVSQVALSMVFKDVDSKGFEEDARLTAIWLWTLKTDTSSINNLEDIDEEVINDEELISSKKIKGDYILEYDAARKISQGLGIDLKEMHSLVEIKGNKARLLSIEERTNYLFESNNTKTQISLKKKKLQQSLFEDIDLGFEKLSEKSEFSLQHIGKTVLDKVHQSMLLFSSGRSEALKRFLLENGVGTDDRFWKLAQALTALYPRQSVERRWIEGVQTYKKGLGL